MADVIVSGHICLDLLPGMARVSQEDLGTPGRLYEVDPLGMATGGAVSNTGLALFHLGVDVGLMGTVGDDLLGRVIIAYLRDQKPELADYIKVQPGQDSSYSVVLAPENADRTFLHCTGTNDTFGAEDVDYTRLTDAKIFHLGYPPLMPRLYQNEGAELVDIFRRAKATGVVTSLDMAMPDPNGPSGKADWRRIVERTLPYVDIFLPSIEEILMMMRLSAERARAAMGELNLSFLDRLSHELIDMGAAVVGFKLGPYGLYARATDDADRLQALKRLPIDQAAWCGASAYYPTYAVEAVGTTGAGDTAYAGFLTALLHGLTLQEAVQMANAVGACSVEVATSTGGVRSWEETRARMASGWPLSTERIKG
ncbi:MAG: sugar kinase [Anaerolineae bacterium]